MVRFKDGVISGSRYPSMIQWLARADEPEQLKIKSLIESEKSLLESIRAIVGQKQSLAYRLRNGAIVIIYPEEGSSFSLELIGEDKDQEQNNTNFYEVYLPMPHTDESLFDYHSRRLTALDLFVDALATGQVIATE
jgi:hypothetical protein